MTTTAQRIWEAVYAATLVQLAMVDDATYHSVASAGPGAPSIMRSAVALADAHSKYARFEPASRFRKRSR